MADRPKVIVVGDIICDQWQNVVAMQQNPEHANIAVRAEGDIVSTPGGAGLVALCLQQLGCDVTLFGCVGVEPPSFDYGYDAVMSVLDAAGVNLLHVTRIDVDTPIKVRAVDEDARVLVRADYCDNQEAYDASANAGKSAYSALVAELQNIKSVVVADYDKGYLAGYRTAIVDDIAAVGGRVFVDCKGPQADSYRGADVIKLNTAASRWLIGTSGTPTKDAQRLCKKLGADIAIITHGAAPTAWAQRRRAYDQEAAFQVPVMDVVEGRNTVGAGDAFMAGFVARCCHHPALLAHNVSVIRDAVLCGHRAAAQKLQTLMPALSSEFTPPVFDDRVIAPSLFVAQAQQLFSQGKRVVFTNGCFDLLHAGHVSFLERAKKLGDYLFVAVDADASVRVLKGEGRPIISQDDRASMLAALRCVDVVTVFDGDDQLRGLIRDVIPAVLVKGCDHDVNTMVGGPIVKANGGKVVTIPHEVLCSTSGTIKKIREVPHV